MLPGPKVWRRRFGRRGSRNPCSAPARWFRVGAENEKRQDRPPAVGDRTGLDYFLLTAFLSSAPGVNLATRRAAILIVAPVCGLRPLRAFLCETENVPKPIKATRSPFLRAAVMLSTAVSIAVVACVLLISQAPAMRSTRSALFIVSPRHNSISAPKRVLGELEPMLGRNSDVSYFPPTSRVVNCE